MRQAVPNTRALCSRTMRSQLVTTPLSNKGMEGASSVLVVGAPEMLPEYFQNLVPRLRAWERGKSQKQAPVLDFRAYVYYSIFRGQGYILPDPATFGLSLKRERRNLL